MDVLDGSEKIEQIKEIFWLNSSEVVESFLKDVSALNYEEVSRYDHYDDFWGEAQISENPDASALNRMRITRSILKDSIKVDENGEAFFELDYLDLSGYRDQVRSIESISSLPRMRVKKLLIGNVGVEGMDLSNLESVEHLAIEKVTGDLILNENLRGWKDTKTGDAKMTLILPPRRSKFFSDSRNRKIVLGLQAMSSSCIDKSEYNTILCLRFGEPEGGLVDSIKECSDQTALEIGSALDDEEEHFVELRRLISGLDSCQKLIGFQNFAYALEQAQQDGEFVLSLSFLTDHIQSMGVMIRLNKDDQKRLIQMFREESLSIPSGIQPVFSLEVVIDENRDFEEIASDVKVLADIAGGCSMTLRDMSNEQLHKVINLIELLPNSFELRLQASESVIVGICEGLSSSAANKIKRLNLLVNSGFRDRGEIKQKSTNSLCLIREFLNCEELIVDFPGIEDLKGIESLRKLKILDICTSSRDFTFKGVSRAGTLQSVAVKGKHLFSLSCMEELAELSSLNDLRLTNVSNLERFSFRSESLVSLYLSDSNCEFIDCPSLENLRIVGLPDVVELSSEDDTENNIGQKLPELNCPNLDSLSLELSSKLSDLSGLPFGLRALNLQSLGVEDLSFLQEISGLEALKIITCQNLSNISDTVDHKSLKELKVFYCPKISSELFDLTTKKLKERGDVKLKFYG